MALNLQTVMLGSEDSKRLADFYRRVLGDPKPDWSDEAGGWFGFEAGDGSLAIGPHSEVTGRNSQPGRIMLAFTVEDVRAEFERVQALGAEVVAEPYQPEDGDTDGDGGGGGEMLLCTFADPDGNYFQLVTPWEPSA